jgi:hypothetical protein
VTTTVRISIHVYLRANLTAHRPITNLVREKGGNKTKHFLIIIIIIIIIIITTTNEKFFEKREKQSIFTMNSVKVKLFLCLTNYSPTLISMGSGCIYPHFLDFATSP